MKTKLFILMVWLFASAEGDAVPITLFQDTDAFIVRAQDIVVANCISVPDRPETYVDGLYPAEVEVLMVLKGEEKPGRLKIVTIYPMKPGTSYLLTSAGGMAFDSHFLAIAELAVVPVPAGFDLKTLNGKSTTEQIHAVFSRHLYEIEQVLLPLKKTQALLERGLLGRNDDFFESQGDVRIGRIYRAITKEKDSLRWLPLKTGKLAWMLPNQGERATFIS